jgi:pilus assembly protein Flp/PilA
MLIHNIVLFAAGSVSYRVCYLGQLHPNARWSKRDLASHSRQVPREKTSIVMWLQQKKESEMKTKLMKFLRDEEGLTVVEYAVAAGLVAAATVAAFQALGVKVAGVITALTALLP